MKICPNCGDKHNKKLSNYCCKPIVNNCLNCGKPRETKCVERMKIYCSQKCSTQHKKNKCLNCGDPCKEKYCKKSVKINCKYCGKEHIAKCCSKIAIYCSGVCAARDPKIKEKTKQTQFKNHGGVYAFNTPKQQETMMKKFGSLGRLGNKEELEKHFKLMMERHGVRTPSEKQEFLERAMTTLMNNYGQIFNNKTISKVNLEFGEKLKEQLGVEIQYEFHLKGKFYDIYLPAYNIAIEINPTITHNSSIAFACKRNKCKQPCSVHKPLSRDYHYKKSKLAMDNDLKLIQVYEWEDDSDVIRIIKGKISESKIKYSARKLELKEITQSEANKFLNLYHVQKGAKGQKYCYGLFNENELLAVATFGRARFNKKYQYEFIRYAVKEGVVIHGGPSKLVKRFVEEVNPKNIVSYVDFNHTSSKEIFLNHSGFVEKDPTGPRLVFHNSKNNKVVSMTSLLIIGADRILGTSYGPKSKCGLNNEEIMLKEGYLKVYTAGNRVFLWGEEFTSKKESEKFEAEKPSEETKKSKEIKKVEVKCQMCGKLFTQKNKSKDGVVGCSRACKFQLRNGKKPCVVCGKEFYPKSKTSKLCSAKCSGKLSNNPISSQKRISTLKNKNKIN